MVLFISRDFDIMCKKVIGRVSFLMLSYNHVGFIEASILSVVAQKDYLQDLELIIIDDGSTDGTVDLIKNLSKKLKNILKIKCYFQEHKGIESISNNFLNLVDLASLDYICFIASDDKYVDEAFKEQIIILENSNSIQAVYGNGINYYEHGERFSVMGSADREVLRRESVGNAIQYVTSFIPSIFIQSLIVKSSFLKSYKCFDSELIADDWVFNIRFFNELKQKSLSYSFVDKPVFIRNLHNGNTSKNILSQYSRIRQVAEKYCFRKENIKAQAFWYSCYIGAKNKDIKSLKFLSKLHFDRLSVIFPSVIELFKLFFIKLLKR